MPSTETDRIGEDSRDEAAELCIQLLLDEFPDGAAVLELGIGNATSLSRRLAERFCLVGIDVSARQVQLAGEAVPDAWFLRADMGELSFALSSFDAVVASHALVHLPGEELRRLIYRIADWLRPGGLLVARLGSQSDRAMVAEAGLEPDSIDGGFGDDARATWVVSRKR